MYSYGSPHMAAQKQDDQHERTFSSYVRIQVVVLKTYLGRWTIGRSGERGSGISVLPARYDDDDEVKRKIRWLLNVIVGIRLDAHWKANVNKNVWCIKWKYIVIWVMIEIKRYILGRRKGNLRLGTITIKRVSPTKSIGIVPRSLVMCGRSKIKKE